MARCLLLNAKLCKDLWVHTVTTAAYIRNCYFNPCTRHTPFYLFTGTKPDWINIHIFGSVYFSYDRTKLTDVKAKSEELSGSELCFDFDI